MSHLVKPPPVFTHPEWTLSNKMHFKNSELERQQAERIEAEAGRLINATDERTKKTLADVDKKLDQRVADIDYWNNELKNKIQETSDEIDSLLVQRERVCKSIDSCYEDILHINTQCLLNRSKRKGIDLVDDDVQKELRKEAEVVKGGIALLKRTLEQVEEQIRLSRKAKYNLEKDQKDKDNAQGLDSFTRSLNTNTSAIALQSGAAKIEPNSVTPEQWVDTTRANILAAERERVNAINMRSIVDRVLQQVADDIEKQISNVDVAFDRRIREQHDAKDKFTNHHAKVVDEINTVEKTIVELQKAIEDKRAPLALAETRLQVRKERPNLELCRDPAQYRMVEEVDEVRRSVAALEAQLDKAQASLRALTRQQLQLADEIALRDHAIFIDEVECVGMRKSLSVERF